jgi:hypothetical protein
MSYATQAVMSRDPQLRDRIAACAATQNVPDVQYWAQVHQWHIAAAPGWDAAYSYAINTGVENPGNHDGVINDNMILSAVQARINETTPPSE